MNTLEIASLIERWADDKLTSFMSKVSSKYNIDLKDLKCLVPDNADVTPAEASASALHKKTDVNLSSLKKDDLKKMCKSRNLAVSGNKAQLLARLGCSQPTKASNKHKKEQKRPSVRKKCEPACIEVKRTLFGNHVFEGLVFDPNTKRVIGTELPDGSVAPLTKKSIDKCNQYKLEFMMPHNLDATDDAREEKLEDDVDDLVVEEEEVEEVEEEVEDEVEIEEEYVYEEEVEDE